MNPNDYRDRDRSLTRLLQVRSTVLARLVLCLIVLVSPLLFLLAVLWNGLGHVDDVWGDYRYEFSMLPYAWRELKKPPR